jgi:shikimate dehydrogenase
VFEQRKIPYQIVTRTLSQKPRVPEILWEQVNRKVLADHPLLVQCTPLGMAPHLTTRPPLNLEGLGQGHYVMDLIYNPLETLFLEECRAKGARVMGGMTMFQAQAEASLRFWSNLPGGEILQNDRIQLVF